MEDQALYNAAETQVYDQDLHRRFGEWMDLKGHTQARVATMLARSTAAVSQYRSQQYAGDVPGLERDIANLLQREQDLEFIAPRGSFCSTDASKMIWEVLEYCDRAQKMGVVGVPSGTGKTETANEYKRRNRATILITLDITTRHPGAVIRRLADRTGGQGKRYSIGDLLEAVIERLRGSRRLIIVDEAHFLSWEGHELLRKLHDCAKVGVAYLGQERLYAEMKGNDARGMLYDQIFSRVAITRSEIPVKKKDVHALARALSPGLDKESLDYLYNRARGKGRFRVMGDLLDLALELGKNQKTEMGIDLLKQADLFLMKG